MKVKHKSYEYYENPKSLEDVINVLIEEVESQRIESIHLNTGKEIWLYGVVKDIKFLESGNLCEIFILWDYLRQGVQKK